LLIDSFNESIICCCCCRSFDEEQRENERLQREQRRDDDIKRRQQAQIDENVQRAKLYEETAKNFAVKSDSQIDKLREQALKDKQAHIEKERQAYVEIDVGRVL
jgi:hypothetical protein